MKFQIYLVLNAILIILLISIFMSTTLSGVDMVTLVLANVVYTATEPPIEGSVVTNFLLTWVRRLYVFLLPVAVLSIMSPIIFFLWRYRIVISKS